MRNKKPYIWTVIAVIAVICVVVILLSGKIRDTFNEYDVVYTYFDEARTYASSLEYSFRLETQATYKEMVRLRDNLPQRFYISKNELSDDIDIIIKDLKSNIFYEGQIKKAQEGIYLNSESFIGGEYILEISLPGMCTGTLEITVDEE